jgi:hypothetical protein
VGYWRGPTLLGQSYNQRSQLDLETTTRTGQLLASYDYELHIDDTKKWMLRSTASG